MREQILAWYKNLPIKPEVQDKLLTLTVTELESFITQVKLDGHSYDCASHNIPGSENECYCGRTINNTSQ